MRKIIAALFAVLLFTVAGFAAERAKALYKASRLSIGDVAISCDDGRAPTVKPMEGRPFVIVSCPLGRNQD